MKKSNIAILLMCIWLIFLWSYTLYISNSGKTLQSECTSSCDPDKSYESITKDYVNIFDYSSISESDQGLVRFMVWDISEIILRSNLLNVDNERKYDSALTVVDSKNQLQLLQGDLALDSIGVESELIFSSMIWSNLQKNLDQDIYFDAPSYYIHDERYLFVASISYHVAHKAYGSCDSINVSSIYPTFCEQYTEALESIGKMSEIHEFIYKNYSSLDKGQITKTIEAIYK